jgi:hypothetical protein
VPLVAHEHLDGALGHEQRAQSRPAQAVTPSESKPTDAVVHARARLLGGEEARHAVGALARRRIVRGGVVPGAHRLMRYQTTDCELEPSP